MANGDFAKRYAKEQEALRAQRDMNGAKLRESEKTEVKLEGGKLVLRKAVLTACAVGSIVGLAATGFGAANVIACAVRPDIGLISFDTLTWGIMTWGGFKLSKKSVPVSMRNSETLRPYYDAVIDVKESLSKKKTK